MRILTNVSRAELDHLVNQPTAKAMIKFGCFKETNIG